MGGKGRKSSSELGAGWAGVVIGEANTENTAADLSKDTCRL